MPVTLDDFHILQARLENLKRQAERDEGALREMASTIKERFGAKNLAHADKMLEKLGPEVLAAYEKYRAARKELEKEFPELLE